MSDNKNHTPSQEPANEPISLTMDSVYAKFAEVDSRLASSKSKLKSTRRWIVLGTVGVLLVATATLGLGKASVVVLMTTLAAFWAILSTTYVLRGIRRDMKATEIAYRQARAHALVALAAQVEESALGFASQQLNSPENEVSLRVLFGFLVDRNIWSGEDVEAFRRILGIRNSIVHGTAIEDMDMDMVTLGFQELEDLVGKLSYAVESEFDQPKGD